jgi:hypothetical protein
LADWGNELVHTHRPHLKTSSGLKAYLVEIVILADQLLKLRLDVHNLLGWEVELHDWYSGFFEVLEEPNFRRLQEHQTAAPAIGSTGGTSDSVDVVSGVVWGIELDDPVDGRDLKVSVGYSYFRGKEDIHLDLLRQHLCRSRLLAWRYRTQRKCWFASAASAFRVGPALEGQCS